MRADAALGETCIVALSGFAESRERARAANFDRYLRKPVYPEQLEDAPQVCAACQWKSAARRQLRRRPTRTCRILRGGRIFRFPSLCVGDRMFAAARTSPRVSDTVGAVKRCPRAQVNRGKQLDIWET